MTQDFNNNCFMFREFYYWAYTYYSKRKRFKGYEDFYTAWLIDGILVLNWVVLSLIVDWLCIITWHFSFIDVLFKGRGKSPISFLFAIILISPVLLFTHYKLYTKKKEIMRYYKNKKMSQFRQDWGKLFFWLYVIFTIASLFIGMVILRKLKIEAGFQ